MLTIEKNYTLEASINTVYEKWISNETIVPPAISMDITPEVGGKYGLVSQFGDKVFTMEGIFKEVIPYSKLVYTWEWDKDGHVSTVTVQFAEDGATTQVSVQHAGFESEKARDAHDHGWDSYLAGFKAFL